jgi:hypothetical protein
MKQHDMERQDGCFLTAMLRRCGGEDRSNFADQFVFHPQRTGLID